MLVEEPRVPPAHLMVADIVCILHSFVFHPGQGILKLVVIDPWRYVPVFWRDQLYPLSIVVISFRYPRMRELP
jgi:hypothetical protein